MTPATVACTDLPILTAPVPRLVIKGSRVTDGRTLLARGGEVAIFRTADDGLAPGQRYVVRRLQNTVKDFSLVSDNLTYGAVRTAGFVTVTAVDEHNALAIIDYACDVIQPGDYLEVYTEPTLPTVASPIVRPDWSDRASILQGTDTRTVFGDGDTFSITRGTVNGVVAGARYAIYRDLRDGIMPLIYLGDAVVMEVGETTSKVVLVTMTDVVTLSDVAIPRRQP